MLLKENILIIWIYLFPECFTHLRRRYLIQRSLSHWDATVTSPGRSVGQVTSCHKPGEFWCNTTRWCGCSFGERNLYLVFGCTLKNLYGIYKSIKNLQMQLAQLKSTIKSHVFSTFCRQKRSSYHYHRSVAPLFPVFFQFPLPLYRPNFTKCSTQNAAKKSVSPNFSPWGPPFPEKKTNPPRSPVKSWSWLKALADNVTPRWGFRRTSERGCWNQFTQRGEQIEGGWGTVANKCVFEKMHERTS